MWLTNPGCPATAPSHAHLALLGWALGAQGRFWKSQLQPGQRGARAECQLFPNTMKNTKKSWQQAIRGTEAAPGCPQRS